MQLKNFGCSLAFGTDLSDCLTHHWATPSQLVWPAIVARELGMTYRCRARGGSGNIQILDRIINEAVVDKDQLFVINWSFIDRFDYGYGTADHVHPTWDTVLPGQTTETARVYYRDLHTEYRDKLNTLMCIRTAIDVLQSRHIPFVMTYADDLFLDTRWNTSPGIAELQQSVRPYLTAFDTMNFLDWCRRQQFPISSTNHPLDSAHRAAAELMLPVVKQVFDKQNTVDH